MDSESKIATRLGLNFSIVFNVKMQINIFFSQTLQTCLSPYYMYTRVNMNIGWSFTNVHILCVYEKSKKATSKPLQAIHVVSYILDTGKISIKEL